MIDGYTIQENSAKGFKHFAAFGVDEPAAIAACRWYNRLLRGRRVFRVVLSLGNSVAVIHG